MRRQRNLLGPQGMGGMVSLWGASSLIKSVQRGTCTVAAGATTGTATITAVDLANCTVRFLGYVDTSTADGTTAPDVHFVRLALTNATTLTGTRAASDATYGRIIRFEVVEFLPGLIRSVQRGFILIPSGGATSATLAITAVDPNKCVTSFLGFSTSYPAASNNVECADVTLTNGTTLTASIANTAANTGVAFEVLEFF